MSTNATITAKTKDLKRGKNQAMHSDEESTQAAKKNDNNKRRRRNRVILFVQEIFTKTLRRWHRQTNSNAVQMANQEQELLAGTSPSAPRGPGDWDLARRLAAAAVVESETKDAIKHMVRKQRMGFCRRGGRTKETIDVRRSKRTQTRKEKIILKR